MPKQCPWPPSDRLASICEQDLCALIIEPGNTATNIAFVIAGVWILLRTPAGSSARWFGWAALAVAAGSSAFHATGLPWTHYGDFLGLFLITGVMTGLNLQRWLRTSDATTLAVTLALPSLLLGLLLLFPDKAVWIYALAAPCCVIEAWLALHRRREINYRYYFLAWLLILLATVAWWADSRAEFCAPSLHGLSGHSAWHVLAAMALLALWAFYLQFAGQRSSDFHPSNDT